MTNSEFSNEFDVLYNNITSNQAPGLDEYEKSVFLTKAQDEILKAYFNPKGNKFLEGYDDNPRRQIDFSMLTTVVDYSAEVSKTKVNYYPTGETNLDGQNLYTRSAITSPTVTQGETTLSSAQFDLHHNSASAILPSNILMMINEQIMVDRGPSGKSIILQVIPLPYIEYSRLMSKPYKRPLQYQAWRISNSSSASNVADLVVGPADTIKKYTIRYIRRPQAIILAPLEGVTLDGQYDIQGCELDPILHQEILQRAVELAKAAYIGNVDSGSNLASMVQLGTNSATNMGMVSSGGRE